MRAVCLHGQDLSTCVARFCSMAQSSGMHGTPPAGTSLSCLESRKT